MQFFMRLKFSPGFAANGTRFLFGVSLYFYPSMPEGNKNGSDKLIVRFFMVKQ